MNAALWLLPVALGDTPWETCLPAATRDAACRLTHFVAENAKSARAELKRIGHPVALRELAIEQLPAQPTAADIERLMAPLRSGIDLGLMSEAGCPAVADPGALLVRRAHELGLPVKPLVGPSSLLLALMASGMNGQGFTFHGYLPAKSEARAAALRRVEEQARKTGATQLFIETPYRNVAMLQSLIALCELSQGESRVFEMAASEVVTVMEIDARVADICGEQLAQLRASRAGNHIEPPTFAHQLAHFRASAAAYQFEVTQEELERAIREEANPCANAN